MRRLPVISVFVAATILAGPVVLSDGIRSTRATDVQFCDPPARARNVPFTSSLFFVPPPPPEFDFDTWDFTPYCFGAAFKDGQPVRGVRFNVKNATLATEDEAQSFTFPNTKERTDRTGTAFRSFREDLIEDHWEGLFEHQQESGSRAFTFVILEPLGGKRVDQIITECGFTFAELCRADVDTLCVDRWRMSDRFLIDLSGFNGGDFTLSPTPDGGIVSLGDGSMWELEAPAGPTDLFQIYPVNPGALELFIQPEVIELFDDIIIEDRLLGDVVPGRFRRAGENLEVTPRDEDTARFEFSDPRTYRFTVGFRF